MDLQTTYVLFSAYRGTWIWNVIDYWRLLKANFCINTFLMMQNLLQVNHLLSLFIIIAFLKTLKHVEKWNEKLCLFWLETCLKLDIQGVFISSWKARIENCMDFKLILHTKASLKFTLLWNLSRQYSILYLPMTGITYGLVNEWEHSCLHKLMDSSLTCMVLLSK